MPKQSIKAEFSSFVAGLNTESSQLNYPENAFQEGINFELTKKGTINRRLGFDYEPSHSMVSTTFAPGVVSPSGISFFKWESAGGSTVHDFIVVQIKHILYVFTPDSTTLSAGGALATIILSDFSAFDALQVTNVKGSLVVACGAKKLALVKFNPSTSTFSHLYYSIAVRDVWGVPSTAVPQYESDDKYRGAYDVDHIYNLYNQSWGSPRKVSGTISDVVTAYYNKYSKYPSNAESVWPAMQYQASSPPEEVVFLNMYEEVLGSTSKAAKGYFIIDALDRGQSRAEAIASNALKFPTMALQAYTPAVDSTTQGASVVCEFAGRVVYGGFNGQNVGITSRSPDFSDHIFFSQLINTEQDYKKCYQEGDPTNRDAGDIVDTDGGFIRLSGAKNIIGMRAVGNSLIVVASNGVWSVTGGNDYGFSATNYRVDKLSSYGSTSPRSIVEDGSRVLFWGNEGIFTVSPAQTGGYSVESISESTIQTFYNSIGSLAKASCTGVYDMLSKQVRWIYQDTEMFSQENNSNELVLDLNIGAFYPIKVKNIGDGTTTSTVVLSAVSLPSFKYAYSQEDVLVLGNGVVSVGTPVNINLMQASSSKQTLRYLVLDVSSVIRFSFGYYRSTSFRDWGVHDAEGFIHTAPYTNKDSAINKQTPWIVSHMKRTETALVNEVFTRPSGCLMSTCWEWSDNNANGRWSREQQLYRPARLYIPADSDTYAPGNQIVTAKSKMRGMGKAFSVMFKTEPAKDCQLIGWSISANGNPIV